jgi:hypothetical protein
MTGKPARGGGSISAPASSSGKVQTGCVWVFAGDDGGRFPHLVIEALRERSVPLLHINYTAVEELELDLSDPLRPVVVYNGEAHAQPSCLWIRFKLQVGAAGIGTPDECLKVMEWSAVSRGLGTLFADVAINGTSRQLAAETKLSQLAHARLAGFATQDSAVTFGKRPVEAFLDRSPQSVMKAMGFPIIPAPDLPDGRTPIVTTAIRADQVAAAPELAFQNNPMFLQRQVTAGFEYRVVAFRDRHFLYRMNGRLEDRRIVDARIVGRRYTLLDSDPALQALCRAYLESIGLEYGVFDLIRDDGGDWLFLECNPEGQMISAAGINLPEVASAFADLIEARAVQNGLNQTRVAEHV